MAITPELLTQIMMGLGVALLVLLVIGAFQLVMIMRKLFHTAESVASMAETAERELTPTLQGVSHSTQSISQLLSRIDRVAGMFMTRIEIVAEGTEVVKDQASRFIHSPVEEVQTWIAGLRKGIEVFLASKGRNGGGESDG